MKTSTPKAALLFTCICFQSCTFSDYPFFISENDSNGVCLDVAALTNDGRLNNSTLLAEGFVGELRTDNEHNRLSGFVAGTNYNGSAGPKKRLAEYRRRLAVRFQNLESDDHKSHRGQNYTSATQSFFIEFTVPQNLAAADDAVIKALGQLQSEQDLGIPTPVDDSPISPSFFISLTIYHGTDGQEIVGYVMLGATDPFLADYLGKTPAALGRCSPNVVFREIQSNGGVSQPADFLWVIDNSSSMSLYQVETAAVADVFAETISEAGFDYRLGVITADGSFVPQLITTAMNDEPFTDDVDEFKERVLAAGTLGSATESGIYTAEQALLSQDFGDGIDGAVTTAGYPRQDANLAVVVLTDEFDQYFDYSGTTFNQSNNLFLERGYSFNGIFATFSSPDYSALVQNTGGIAADIDSGDFSSSVQAIADNYIETNNELELNSVAISNSIVVTANDGETIPEDLDNGWLLDADENIIRFNGDSVIYDDSIVEVSYATWE